MSRVPVFVNERKISLPVILHIHLQEQQDGQVADTSGLESQKRHLSILRSAAVDRDMGEGMGSVGTGYCPSPNVVVYDIRSKVELLIVGCHWDFKIEPHRGGECN